MSIFVCLFVFVNEILIMYSFFSGLHQQLNYLCIRLCSHFPSLQKAISALTFPITVGFFLFFCFAPFVLLSCVVIKCTCFLLDISPMKCFTFLIHFRQFQMVKLSCFMPLCVFLFRDSLISNRVSPILTFSLRDFSLDFVDTLDLLWAASISAIG